MKKILLLLANGFEIYEASVFIDVMGWNKIDGDGTTSLYTCGIEKEISSTFNVKITADYSIKEINVNDFDALAIPGGFENYGFYKDAFHDEFQNLIRAFEKKKKTIATICVGALPLAKSGILGCRKATTYNLMGGHRLEQLKSYGVEAINEPMVIDKNVITSWNPSTAIDVAFKLLEILTSKENSDKVREIMGFL